MYNSEINGNQIKIDLNEENIPIEYINVSIINNYSIHHEINNPNNIIKKFESDDIINIIYGYPLINNNLDYNKVNRIINSENINKDLISSINGEFLLISLNKKDLSVKIINDRFTSYPLYYCNIGRNFYCSTNYFKLIKLVKNNNDSISINNRAFAEFLWFRKIHGDITYHNEINFLGSASSFEYFKNQKNITKYWIPNFSKNNNNLKTNIDIFVEKLFSSIKIKTNHFNTDRIGLFLSGGMDTRLILSSLLQLNIRPICFTVGYSKEGEYKTAKKLTSKYNLKHYFLELPNNLYDIFWEKKLKLSSGFHVPFHNIFLGFKEFIQEKTDVLLHGHGLDYLFQGMYLPVNHINIFGKKTYYNYFQNLKNKDDIVNFYIHNITYRNWRVNLNKLSKKELVSDYLRKNIDEIFIKLKKFSFDNFDIWESFMINNLSRHYSQTDIIGIHTNNISTKISNDNNLFDFYLSLNRRHRKNGILTKEALKKLNLFMANTKSANTNYKITAYPTELNFYYAYLKFMRYFSNKKKYQLLSALDRTWPNHDKEVIIRTKLNNELKKLTNSEQLIETLDFFDKDKLIKYINSCLEEKEIGGGQFLMSLLTIEKFLNEIEKY